jgi:cardiolipin synthase C
VRWLALFRGSQPSIMMSRMVVVRVMSGARLRRRSWPYFRRSLYQSLVITLAVLTIGCSSTRFEVPRPISRAIERPQETVLWRTFASQLAATPDQSGFRLLVSGQEAFLARAALAEAAERTLDFQYYIIGEDATATLLLYRALRAAQRGARVRMLIDDMYAVGRDFDLANFAAHPNVEVRVFNPFARRGPFGISRLFEFIGDSARLNRRMHNKLWIADNAVAVLGGRNLGDAYFNVGGETDFADLDVLAAGPVVTEISRSFDEYWNSELAVPIGAFVREPRGAEQPDLLLARMAEVAERFRDTEYAGTLRATDLGRLIRSGQLALVSAPARILYASPDMPQPTAGVQQGEISSVLRNAVEAARREVILVSPYFIPSERGVGVLCSLAKRGVRVRVLTNSLASTDVPVVHAGYAKYRPPLLTCGVELHELRPGPARTGSARVGLSSGASLHAKAVVVDRASVLIGSMNLDPRSRLLNTEVAVLAESAVLGEQLGVLFDDAVSPDQAFRVALEDGDYGQQRLIWTGSADGKPVSYTSEPLASWWRRIVASLLGMLAPEELL